MDWNVVIPALCTFGGLIVAAVVGAFGYLYRGIQEANDKAIAKAEAARDKAEKERDVFRELLQDAVKTLPVAVNHGRERQGLPLLPEVAPVVPISHSPTTPEQERQAEMFTALAAVAAAKVALGMPPRVADPIATEVIVETTVTEVAVGVSPLDITTDATK